MDIPGVGVITASAMVAAVGTGAAFAKGRDFAAWLGLVPKQISTGNRTILGGLSKRGNRYLRTLFVGGAQAILQHPHNWHEISLRPLADDSGPSAASECAGCRVGQQAGAHRLERVVPRKGL